MAKTNMAGLPQFWSELVYYFHYITLALLECEHY